VTAVADNADMIPDEALQSWNPASPAEARALVQAVRDSARHKGVDLSDPPPEPTNCCDSGCVGCVWEAHCGEVAYWRDECLLRWS
jgi:2-iminoacetate synthase ThiH